MNDDLLKRTLKTVAWLVGVQLASMILVLAVFFILSRGPSGSEVKPPAVPAAVSPIL